MANELLRTFGIDDSARQRVLEKWRTFLLLNGFDHPSGEALRLWVGQATNGGLSAGSRHTYATYIRATIPRDDPLLKKVMKSIMRAHADAETSAAIFVEFDQLVEIIEHISDALMRSACYVMLLAGMRMIGVTWLRHRQIAAQPSDNEDLLIAVQVRVDKNAWKRVHRDQLEIRKDYTSTLTALPTNVRKIINGSRSEQDKRPFWNLTTAMINKELRQVSESFCLPHATTMSFRKSYMHRVFTRCGDDMDEIRRMTLHHSKFVTKAHYFQWRHMGYADPEARSSSSESSDNED